MELHGTALAQSNRMRERTVSSTPSLVTPAVAGAAEPVVPAAEALKPAPAALGAREAPEALDKYDISLIACTD